MSAKTPFRVDIGKTVETVSSEVVSFIKTDGTADAGEVAGTIVYGRLAKSPVLNLLGDREGEYTGSSLSTSITFTTGVMNSTKEVGFVYDGRADERLTLTAAKLTENGQWSCDYYTGLFVIKKLTAGTSQTITSYKARAGGSSSIAIDEFPAASVATNNYANPTTTDVKTFNMIHDGSTWDMMPGDSTYGVKTQPTLIPQAYDNTRSVIQSVNAPQTGSTYTWSSDSSSALEASSVIKAAAGNLRLFSGVIDASLASGTYYLQFFNQTSVPADATAVAANFIAPTVIKHTNGTPTPINLDFTNNCIAFSVGGIWCLSSTFYTKTITTAVVNATVLYK